MSLDDLQTALSTLGLLGIVIALAYLYSIRTFNVFKRAGIPGPTPIPIFGNALDMSNTNLMTLDLNLRKKYGKFVGTFAGTTPMLMVYDADWLQEAFIKNLNVFMNRNRTTFGGAIDTGIFSVEGDHWKHARKTLSPVFTSLKLRKMIPDIQKCANIFVDILRQSNGKPLDIRSSINLLTLDVISITAFGIGSDVQNKPDGLFPKHAFLITNSSEANRSFKEKLRLGVVVALTFLAPSWLQMLVSKLFNLAILNPQAMDYLESLVETVLDERKKGSPYQDLLQMLADNEVSSSAHQDTLVDSAGNSWTRKGLTRKEVIGNSILFMFAGFQTTADSMTFIFYELAHHPEVQQKIFEEIMDVCDTEQITIEQVNQLKYLEYSINETLRLYPQGFRFDRVATEDINVRDIQIVKGTIVTASPWVIHRDEEIWEDPEMFKPDRFLPENFTERHSAAFIPFGIGNRSCIGSRLALLEMKITVISAVRAFRIQRNEFTPSRPIKFMNTVPLIPLATEEPITVSFTPRDY